jgi:hypothetical protein
MVHSRIQGFFVVLGMLALRRSSDAIHAQSGQLLVIDEPGTVFWRHAALLLFWREHTCGTVAYRLSLPG